MLMEMSRFVVSNTNMKMMEHVLESPKMIMEGISKGRELCQEFEIKRQGEGFKILWYGVGASAIIGDYIDTYLANTPYAKKLSVNVRRTYAPRTGETGDLYVFYSYSGNTFEVVRAFKKVMERNIRKGEIVVFASGGIMGDLAKKFGVMYVPLPGGYVSRSHVPFGIAIATTLIASCLGIGSIVGDLQGAAKSLKAWMSDMVFDEENMKTLSYIAKKLSRKLVSIVVDDALFVVAKRFVAQFNENAKHFASIFQIPEGCHNYIVGLRRVAKKFFIIMLRRRSEDEITKRYMDAVEDMLLGMDMFKLNVEDSGNFSWTTLLKPTLIADILSVLLADIKGEDCFDIEEIVRLKGRISEGET